MKEIAIEKKKNRCSRFGRSLGAHNLTNRIHIQLHLPDEICYLSCSSKCFMFFFAAHFFFFLFRLLYLSSSILFVCMDYVWFCFVFAHCFAKFIFFFVLHFHLHSVCLMIMLQKPVRRLVFFGEYSSMLPVSTVSQQEINHRFGASFLLILLVDKIKFNFFFLISCFVLFLAHHFWRICHFDIC